jgi:hypothetical protein
MMNLKYFALTMLLAISTIVATEKPDDFKFHSSSSQVNDRDVDSLEKFLSDLTVNQSAIQDDGELDKLANSLTNLTTTPRFSVKFFDKRTFPQEIRDAIPGVLRTYGLGDLLEQISQIAPTLHIELVIRFAPSTSKLFRTKRVSDFDQVTNSLKRMRMDEKPDESKPLNVPEEELDTKPYYSTFSGKLMTNQYLYKNLSKEQKQKLRKIIHGAQAKRITTAIANLYPKEDNARAFLYLARL